MNRFRAWYSVAVLTTTLLVSGCGGGGSGAGPTASPPQFATELTSRDGKGSAATFAAPLNLRFDQNGVLHVLDSDGRIRRIAADSTVSTLAISQSSIKDFAFDTDGSLFMTTVVVVGQSVSSGLVYTGGRVLKASPGGAVTNLTGTAIEDLMPVGLAPDGAGGAYVALTRDSTVRRVTAGGAITLIAGIPGQRLVAKDGTAQAATFASPGRLAMDSQGNLILLESGFSGQFPLIRRVTPQGAVTTLAGSTTEGYRDGPGATALFHVPTDLATDRNGNVYVADLGNHVIRKIDAQGVVSTLAGSVGVRGHADGQGTAAQFCAPFSVAVDASGNVFVSDQGNRTIRKVTPTGAVTTIAGQVSPLADNCPT